MGGKFLIHHILRREELCPGEHLCPAAGEIGRCEACPLSGLDSAMSGQAGQSVGRVLEIDAQLQWGGRVDLDDLPFDEFQLLKTLRVERDKLNEKKAKEHGPNA